MLGFGKSVRLPSPLAGYEASFSWNGPSWENTPLSELEPGPPLTHSISGSVFGARKDSMKT